MIRHRVLLWAVLATFAAGPFTILHGQAVPGLAGVIRAEGTDQLLPGARVVVSRKGVSIGQTVSDRDGRFVAAVPDGGGADLVITKAGYAPFRMTVGAGAEPSLEIRLTPGAVITGRVVDAAGLPARAFAVQLRRTGGTNTAPGPWISTTTNDLGEYRVGSLPAGVYEVGPGNAASALLGAALPEQARRGQSPGTLVELQAGRETSHDITRPPSPVTTAQSAEATRKALDSARQMLGSAATPVDPATAGRVSGVVTIVDTASASAVVRLVPQDGATPFVALTDEQGRYDFDAVPPGAYRAIAQGDGAAAWEYGATPANRTGSWLTVRERQHVERIDIALPRAAVIAGRVVDAYGEPLEGLRVEARQARTYGGRLVLTPPVDSMAFLSSLSTDDRGQFRLHGLAPGRYYIVASEPAPPGQRPSGGIQEMMQFALSQTLGGFSTPARPHAYYPGRSTVQEASPIVVDIGVDALGVDLAFLPATGGAISGVVLGSDGTPLSAQLTLSVSRRSGATAVPPYLVSTGADGTFSFPYVVPGEYALRVQEQQPDDFMGSVMALVSSFGDGITGVSVTGGGGTTDQMSVMGGVTWTADSVPEFGTTFIQVTGGETLPLTLHTNTGSALSGHLTFEGPQQPSSPTAFAIGFAAADSDTARAFVPAARGTKDGTFEAFGLVGPMRLMATNTPEGWWLKSATIDGVNAAEQPVTFPPAASRANVEVVFSSARSGVTGRVVNRAGEPVMAATVLAFPADWTRWHAGTRYLRQAPAKDGQFELSALPPGRYYVTAVDAVAAIAIGEWQEPELLERLIPLAHSVSVREGGLEQVKVTVIDVPR